MAKCECSYHLKHGDLLISAMLSHVLFVINLSTDMCIDIKLKFLVYLFQKTEQKQDTYAGIFLENIFRGGGKLSLLKIEWAKLKSR